MSDVITVSGLHKSFGRTVALDGLDLTVREGEVHGFLGPNGAGKSTTIRILLGLLRADRGFATVLGKDPWAEATELHRQLAYVPGDVVLWPSLSGGEVIDLLGRLRGGIDEDRRRRLVERFELDETKKGKAYSKGNRQKVALVAALASGVPLLVLDEPTAGLDPLMEEVFQSELTALKDDGRTVLLSSHILSEVEKACDRVSIVRAGRIVDTGSLAELRHLTRTRVHAVLASAPTLDEVRSWRGVHDVVVDNADVRLSVDAEHLGEPGRRPGHARRHRPHLPAAHARGAVPRPLPDAHGCRGLAAGAAVAPRAAGAAGMTAATAPTGSLARSIPVSTRLAGYGQLLRLAWRRDRILIPSSVLGLVVLAVGSAQATLALYPTDEAASEGLATVLSNPSVIALYGPVASSTADALAVFKTVMMGAFLTAVLGFVVVRRHTRTEEDEGRLELLGAGVVGRWAPLAAAVTLGTVAVVAASAVSGLGLASLGMDVAGSVAFAVSWMTAGLAMVGVAAVVVQLASTTRGAAGLGFGSLGAMFALRAIADSADTGTFVHGLGWLSPLGWSGRVEAYGADRTWLLLPGVLTLALGVAVAVALLDRRDLGAGLIPARSGPARAGRLLTGPFPLVAKLARGTILGWTVGIVLGGVVVGSLLGSVGDMVADPAIKDLLEKLGGTTGTVENVYLATEIHFVAVAVAAVGIALVLRLVGAERSGLGEVVLATPTSRLRWFSAHVALPVLLTTGLMALLGVVVGLVAPSATAAAPSFGASVGATMSALPAIWVMTGVTALLVGALPRFAPFAWGVLLVTFMITEIGPLTELPSWVMDLSPFTHLSPLPGGSFEVVSAAVLTLIALALMALGGLAYQNRDAA